MSYSDPTPELSVTSQDPNGPALAPSGVTVPAREVDHARSSTGVTLLPGDVVVTPTKDKGGWWIRLWAKLQRKPDQFNHIALFTHYDSAGVPRGLEGRPGGFGWVDLNKYLDRPGAITNVGQPGRTDEKRQEALALARQLIAVPYDWRAILGLGAQLFSPRLLRLVQAANEWPEGKPPGHVVCSSSLDWIYEEVGWVSPGGIEKTRWTAPHDWATLITANGWDKPPGSV